MFDESEEVSTNPLTKEMIEDIELLIENYIPPFMERYEEKLQDIVLYESDNISSVEDLKEKIIKKLGIGSLEEPLRRFIIHSVRPKLEPVLPQEEAEKQKAMVIANKTIDSLVDVAINYINNEILQLLTPETSIEQEEKESLADMDEDTLVADVIGEYVEIVEDKPVEAVGADGEAVTEESEEEILEYPSVVSGLVELPVEPLAEEVQEDTEKSVVKMAESLDVLELDALKDLLTNQLLEKYSDELRERLSDEEEFPKAKELLKKKIESEVEENLAKRKQ